MNICVYLLRNNFPPSLSFAPCNTIIPTDNTIIMKHSLQYNQSLDASIFQILSKRCNNIHLHSDAQKTSMNLSAKILIQFATKNATTCLLRNHLPIKKLAPFVMSFLDSLVYISFILTGSGCCGSV